MNIQTNIGLALLKTLVSKPFADWGLDATVQTMQIFYSMLAEPTAPHIKQGAATALDIILRSSSITEVGAGITTPAKGEVTFDKIASTATEVLTSGGDRSAELQLATRALAQHVADG